MPTQNSVGWQSFPRLLSFWPLFSRFFISTEKVFMTTDFRAQTIPSLYAELARSLSGEIDTSHRSLKEHSQDGSPCTIAPHVIVYPKTIDDVKKVIARADEYRIPLSVRGGGKSSTGGALIEGIAVNMTKYFNHIRHVDMLGNTISVDAGVPCKKLREHIGGWGMEIPFLTEQDDDYTIGGVVATKNVSPSSFEHGSIASSVIGLSVVLANGEAHILEDGITPSGNLLGIYQSLFPLLSKEAPHVRGAKPLCPEDNSGYNIWGTQVGVRQLINNLIGSQGTLAIITGIKLRIVPKRPHQIATLLRVPSYEDLPKWIAITKEHGVDELFMYDTMLENTYKEHYEKTEEVVATSIPHILTLVATLSGTDMKMLREKEKRLVSALGLPDGAFTSILRNHPVFSLIKSEHRMALLASYGGGELVPCATGNGIIVPVEHLHEALNDIETYHTEHHLLFSVSGNAGSGHIAVTTLVSPHDARYTDIVVNALEQCYTIAKRYKGSGSASSGDGLLGTPYLPLFFPPKALEIFSKVKTIWDPHNILNPSKKIAIETSYIKNRILPPTA